MSIPSGRHVEISTGRTCFVREIASPDPFLDASDSASDSAPDSASDSAPDSASDSASGDVSADSGSSQAAAGDRAGDARGDAVSGSPEDSSSDRPTVLLLHGWVASGGLNWLRAFDSLSKHFRVLAPDFRGHARGEACRTNFAIEECADDMGALLDLLCPGRPAIVVGYSMGGMVAQELWRRHRDQVGGLVLSATSCAPVPVSRGRDPFTKAMSFARSTLREVSQGLNVPLRFSSKMEERMAESFGRAVEARMLRRAESEATAEEVRGVKGAPLDKSLRAWARREFSRHHWPTVLDAGRAIAEFDTRPWIGEVDVPTTVMLTKRDRLVPPGQQKEMATRIPGARIEAVDAGHFACVRRDFGPRILRSALGVEKARA